MNFALRKIRSLYYRGYKNYVNSQELKWFNSNHEAKADLDAVIRVLKDSGAVVTSHARYKLWSLSLLYRRLRPKTILELGTGASTVILADYLHRENSALAVCVDESEKWMNNSREMIKKQGIALDQISFRHCATRVFQESGEWTSCYADPLNEHDWDLVFIDGPSAKHKPYVNTDFQKIVDQNPPKYLVVDQRAPTVAKMIKMLSDRYEANPSELFEFENKFAHAKGASFFSTIPEYLKIRSRLRPGYTYFSVFKRREF